MNKSESLRPLNIFLFLSAIIPVYLMAVVKIGDYDIWFHLKAGEYILETGRLRHMDPFSYTNPDLPWIVHSWLSAVVFHIVEATSGIKGLILFNALMISAAFTLLYLNMRLFMEKGRGIVFAIVILVLAAYALRFRMWVRPHTFEFIYLMATLYILNQYRSGGKNRLYLLPLIALLWVNTHGSFILALIVPCIYVAGDILNFLLRRTKETYPEGVNPLRMARSMAIIAAINLAASLINPDFYQALVSSFTILSPVIAMIDEFQPLTLNHLWGYALRYTWGFSVLVILSAVGFIINRRKIDFVDILLLLAFLLMSIKGIRFLAEFSLIASIVVVKNLNSTFISLIVRRERVIGLIVAVVFIIALPIQIANSAIFSFGLGVKEHIFPEGALDFIDKARIKGNIFNSYAFGDYIIYRWFPEKKVFIHGHNRSDYFPEEFYKDYVDAHESADVWRTVTDKYNITHTVLEYYRTDIAGKEAVLHLAVSKEWVPVYWDSTAIVYLKRGAENNSVVEKHGYRLIRPSYLDFSYIADLLKKGLGKEVESELTRLISVSPYNEEAYLARAYLYFQLGRTLYPAALTDLKEAARINPAQSFTYSAMGLIYLKLGESVKAEEQFHKALKLDPTDPSATGGLEIIEKKKKKG